MIKKFKEFIKEGKYGPDHLSLFPYSSDRDVSKDITKILQKVEVEDQFLRLKEVLNCDVTVLSYSFDDMSSVVNYYVVSFYINDLSIVKEINLEVENIKHRMENMFPIEIRIMKYLGMDPPLYQIGIIPRKNI